MLICSSLTFLVLQSEGDPSACETPQEKRFALEDPAGEVAVAPALEEGCLDSPVHRAERAIPQKA